jgi:hypothetical protein
LVSQSIILNNKAILTVNEFLDLSNEIVSSNIEEILELNFDLDYSILKNYLESERICPIIQLAKLKDAEEIAEVFKEVYQETYPYKRMENAESIKYMIDDPNYIWFIFRLNPDETIGCFATHLESEGKRGFMHGYVIKKKYHRIIDIFKAFIGCAIYLWKTYNNILIWYGEMRTNESVSQFFTSIVGLKPIAFLPNKDIFFNKVESDILHVIYNKKALKNHRSEETPKIIRQVLNCYSYTNKRYNLGLPTVSNPNIQLNINKIEELREKLSMHLDDPIYGNKIIAFSLKDSDSYFKFQYNEYSKNIEKTEYKVRNLEELSIFIEELNKLINKLDINYCECIISAYNPEHQKIFIDNGFKPRGYIPSWNFNSKKNTFEDCVVFNYHKGNIDKDLKIIPETYNLLKTLNFFEDKKKLINPI